MCKQIILDITESLERCCEDKGVPSSCISMCQGGCGETPWKIFNKFLTDRYSLCHKHMETPKICCDKTGRNPN